MVKKIIALIGISLSLGLFGKNIGLNAAQSVSVAIFSVSILATLFFWDFRLTFVFLGTSALLMTRAIDIEHLIKFSSLEVILFLIGMMVLVGLLKETGFFAWLVSLILRTKNLTANKFLFVISVISALSACAIDEVTSIIFIVAAIFEICDYFEVDPVPFVIIAVLSTNIGSSGTALGNPIGILIASKSGLTFEDFLRKAFPITVLCLGAAIFIVRHWYRAALKELDEKIRQFGQNEILIKLISVPPGRPLKTSLAIFAVTLLSIALHRRLELFCGLGHNTVLLTVPLVSSGLVMAWKWRKAREYIERDVEWPTLLFFLLIFAQAGTLKFTGATDILAQRLAGAVGNSIPVLTTVMLWIATWGSSILDNVVLVAALIPVVQSFQQHLAGSVQPLWWALLFGGCLGGNITLVGSTANIVALGMLEKERNIRIRFFRWFWVGLTVGMVTTMIAWISLLVFPIYR
jgi:Na+/H+ antiporter NhaD/arsenite permease-like protein